MSDYPNTPDQKPNHSRQFDPNYPTYTQKNRPNWIWLVLFMLAALGVGLFAGKLWGEKQATAEGVNSDKIATPQTSTGIGGTGDAAGSQTAAVSNKPVLTVETVTPAQSVVENTLTADGTISPETTATVNGKVNGVAIDKVLVKEGDRVQKGQVLAVFDDDEMQQNLIQAKAEVAEAESRFNNARKQYEKAAPLLKMGAVSQQEVDSYKAAADQAYASVIASKARLDNQGLRMQNANVVAPVSGVISEKNADVGSVPGPQPLFTIIEDGRLEWQAQVAPNQIANITVGTPVEVSLPNNNSVQGRVSRIAPTTEQGSRQITIYAALQNHPSARAGMYQRGTFKLGNDAKITIPVSAVVTQDGYDYVMQVKALKDDDRNTIYRINRIKVKLGERTGERVVLLEPLPGSGNIVRQGGSFLNDGDVVRIASPAAKQTP